MSAARGALKALADSIILLAGVLGCVLSFVSAFDLPARTDWLLLMSAALSLGFLGALYIKKLKFIPLLAAGVVYGVLIWFNIERLAHGAAITGSAVIVRYSEVIPQITALYPIAELTPLAASYACTLFLLFAFAPVSLLIAWAVKRQSFIMAFAFTLPFPASAFAITLTPGALSLFLLAAFWSAMALSSLSGRAGAFSGAKIRFLTLLPAAALFAVIWLALPPGAYERPPELDALRSSLVERVKNPSSGQPSQFTPPLTSGNGGASAGRAELQSAGALTFRGGDALKVYDAKKRTHYLRGYSGAVYTGGSWEQLSNEALGELERILAKQGKSANPLQFSGLALAPGGAVTSISVENAGADGSFVYAPYSFSSYETTKDGSTGVEITMQRELSGMRFVNDAYIKPDGDIPSHTFVIPDDHSLSSAMDISPYVSNELDYREFALKHYTALPGETRERMVEIARSAGISPGGGRADIVDAVARYIRSSAVYDINTPPAPQDSDFVEYFLTEGGRGYCLHFASAATVMLRALGVPARYVEGYTVRPEDYGGDGWAVVPDKRFHAWAEVYYDGIGWLPIDVTPGGGEPRPSVSASPSASPTPAPSPFVSSAADIKTPEGGQPFPWAFAAASIPLLGACVALLRRSIILKRRLARFSRGYPNRRALQIYAYIQKLSAYERPAEDIEALALKAKYSRHTLREDELAYMQGYAKSLAVCIYESLPAYKKLVFKYIRALI